MSDITLTELKRQHKALAKEIKQMQAKPGCESMVVNRLKREKLHVKEQIQALGGKTSGMAAEEKLAAEQAVSVPQPAEPVVTPQDKRVHNLLPPLRPPYVDDDDIISARSSTSVLESASQPLPAECYGHIPKRA